MDRFGRLDYLPDWIHGGVMMGDGLEAAALNQVYNLADFVNKILFGLIIWNLAVKDSGQGAH